MNVQGFVVADNLVCGVSVKDTIGNNEVTVRAKAIVNAAGPWVDDLRKADDSLKGKRLRLTKGVHIVVPHYRLPMKQAIYFDVDDGRMIFAIPRGRVTYIGTTDTNYEGDKDDVSASLEDATYLLNAVNNTFPSCKLMLTDIESSWAGLRPLIHEDGKSASELSRKDEIFESPSGLISIAGGKLTGYRKMAERVVNLVIKKHFNNRQLKPSHTERIKIDSNGFSGSGEVVAFVQELRTAFDLSPLPDHTINATVENFGVNAKGIFAEWASNPNAEDPDYYLLRSQLNYCIQNEMVITITDFFVRRTGLMYFDIQKVIRYKEKIATEMQQLFHWDEKRKTHELAILQRLIGDAQLKTG
jgi:glycerol-3-phosphate dehydrogenase